MSLRSASAVALGIVAIVCLALCHPVIIQEGNVGVVYHFGALSTAIILPGLTYHIFFVRTVHEIQITTQTDSVTNVPCATNNGVLMEFSKVEVVNRLPITSVHDVIKRYSPNYDRYLIFSKIPAAMMQFCSKHSFNEVYIEKFSTLDEFLMEELQRSLLTDDVGLEIIDVRFGKPNIPPAMATQYDNLQRLETEKQLALKNHELDMQKDDEKSKQVFQAIENDRKKKLAEKESEHQQELAQIQIRHEQEMAKINSSRSQEQARITGLVLLDRLENDRNVSRLEYTTYLLTQETHLWAQVQLMKANVSHTTEMLHALANQQLHTRSYVELEVAKSIGSNTKIYWGEKLPSLAGWLPLASTFGDFGSTSSLQQKECPN